MDYSGGFFIDVEGNLWVYTNWGTVGVHQITASITGKIENIQSAIAEIQSQLSTAQSTISQHTDLITALNTQLSELQSFYASLDEQQKQDALELSNAIEELEARIDSLEQTKTAHEGRIGILEGDVNDLLDRIGKLETEDIVNLGNDIETIQGDIKKLQDDLKTANDANALLRSDLEKIDAAIKLAQVAIGVLEQENADLKDEIAVLKARLLVVETLIHAAGDDNWYDQFQSLITEAEKARNANQDLLEIIAGLREQLENQDNQGGNNVNYFLILGVVFGSLAVVGACVGGWLVFKKRRASFIEE